MSDINNIPPVDFSNADTLAQLVGLPPVVAPLMFLAPDDDLAAHGDDLRDRDYIERLIINDDSPNPWELC